jgi:hypothetical protein
LRQCRQLALVNLAVSDTVGGRLGAYETRKLPDDGSVAAADISSEVIPEIPRKRNRDDANCSVIDCLATLQPP